MREGNRGSTGLGSVAGDVRFTWVVNDTAEQPLRAEHGFAVWIETPGGAVLFDTGGSGDVLLSNLAKLDLDPTRLDAVVLSHGHDDHTGGMGALLPLLRRGTRLYAHPTLFRPRLSRVSGELQHRGMRLPQETLADRLALHLSDAPTEVVPGIWTTGEIRTRSGPEGRSRYHFIPGEGGPIPDPYEDDMSLVVELGPDERLLLCGCCHAGLLNTLGTVRSRWAGDLMGIAGGVHLSNAPGAVIRQTIGVLQPLRRLRNLWLGHCSGDAVVASAEAHLTNVAVRRGTAGQRMVFRSGDALAEQQG